MSILQPIYPTPNVNDIVNQIKSINANIFRFLRIQIAQSFNIIWNDPSYTPQEIVTNFGTDAATLFTIAQQVQQIMATVDPTYTILTPPNTVTINSDGTVTIGDAI